MVKPWYGQNSLWQKITRSNGSGQTAPSRNRFRSKYGQTLSGQMRSNIIWSKYGHFLRSNMISNAVKHYLVKIRSNIICSEYGQFLSGQKPKRPPASPKTFRGRRFGRGYGFAVRDGVMRRMVSRVRRGGRGVGQMESCRWLGCELFRNDRAQGRMSGGPNVRRQTPAHAQRARYREDTAKSQVDMTDFRWIKKDTSPSL